MQEKLCFETIRIEKKIAHNIRYHQKRFEDTRKALFNTKIPIDLQDLLAPPSDTLLKCRITYGKDIKKIEYIPYIKNLPKTLILVESNLKYDYKFTDRSMIDALKSDIKDEDIIIIKDGVLTDTSIANIALFDGKEWITPKQALLKGTMRAKLLDERYIKEADIQTDALHKFKNFALMNAMLGFEIINEIKIVKGDQCLKIF
ncbi:MAG: aminotransferase class IV [Campylobacterales bacterium]|nr:aminotransferase class IV [Campylobacterales bacterium]